MNNISSSLIMTGLVLSSISVAIGGTHQENIAVLRSIPMVEGFEERSPQKESYITQELKNIFRDIQHKAAGPQADLKRATHNRGSCFEAEFTMLSRSALRAQYQYSDKLIADLKQGIFSQEKSYPAQIRFANAKGERHPDTKGDVRGIGLSIDLKGDSRDFSGESRQDYSFNSTPMFAVNNIKEFHELMKTAAFAQGKLSYVPNPFYLKSTIKAAKLLKRYERSDSLSYATHEYWGNIPNVHGLKVDGTPKNISKIKLTPCDGKGTSYADSTGKTQNFLQKDIALRAQTGDVCFFFQVQLFDQKKLAAQTHPNWSQADWIENGGELWSEEILPFYTVAKVEIKKNTSNVSCDNWYVNPRLHANPQNMPVGSISRVRAEVEEASRARRLGDLK